MRTFLLLFVFVSLVGATAANADARVNAVVGDASWHARTGQSERVADDERARIQTHLRYVLAILRSKSPRGTAATQVRRAALLQVLAAYAEAGVFPRRTDDAYEGRRPRFIDDRGVHCAVGYLIAKSGFEKLAQRIDRDEEYAFVHAMRTPGIDRWARAHGFSRDELASIQPSYRGPPTPRETRAAIRAAIPSSTLECAKRGPPTSFRIRVRGTGSGAATVHSRSDDDPFVACMVERLGYVERGGGAYDGRVETYRFRMRVEPPALRALLQRRLDEVAFDPDSHRCVPRPGAIPSRAFVRVRLGRAGPHVRVGTEPRNPEVAQCLADYVHGALAAFQGIGGPLRARRAVELGTRTSDARLQQHLDYVAPIAATECARWLPNPVAEAPAVPRWPSIRVAAAAAIDADAVDVTIEGGLPDFDRCVAEALRERLHESLAVPRRTDDEVTPYLRLDADVRVETTLRVEPPHERERRLQEERERFEREQARDYLH